MGDLKLFAKDNLELEGLLQTVKKSSDNIGMKFELEKYPKANFLKGKLEKSTSIELDNSMKIKELELVLQSTNVLVLTKTTEYSMPP